MLIRHDAFLLSWKPFQKGQHTEGYALSRMRSWYLEKLLVDFFRKLTRLIHSKRHILRTGAEVIGRLTHGLVHHRLHTAGHTGHLTIHGLDVLIHLGNHGFILLESGNGRDCLAVLTVEIRGRHLLTVGSGLTVLAVEVGRCHLLAVG